MKQIKKIVINISMLLSFAQCVFTDVHAAAERSALRSALEETAEYWRQQHQQGLQPQAQLERAATQLYIDLSNSPNITTKDVQKILEKYPTAIQYINALSGQTLLSALITNDNLDEKTQCAIANLLLDRGVPINYADALGQSDLYYAVSANLNDLVDILIQHGVLVDQMALENAQKNPMMLNKLRRAIGMPQQTPAAQPQQQPLAVRAVALQGKANIIHNTINDIFKNPITALTIADAFKVIADNVNTITLADRDTLVDQIYQDGVSKLIIDASARQKWNQFFRELLKLPAHIHKPLINYVFLAVKGLQKPGKTPTADFLRERLNEVSEEEMKEQPQQQPVAMRFPALQGKANMIHNTINDIFKKPITALTIADAFKVIADNVNTITLADRDTLVDQIYQDGVSKLIIDASARQKWNQFFRELLKLPAPIRTPLIKYIFLAVKGLQKPGKTPTADFLRERLNEVSKEAIKA